jgi:hypothetical protein
MVRALHAAHDAADRAEPAQVPGEGVAGRVHGVRLEGRVLKAILIEHVHHRELAAEGVAPAAEAHLVQLVRVGLDKDRHAAVLERSDRAGLVAEVRQAQDHAVVLAAVVGEELRVAPPLRGRFHRAETCGRLVEHQRAESHALDGGLDLRARRRDQRLRKEAAVAEIQCECHFVVLHRYRIHVFNFARASPAMVASAAESSVEIPSRESPAISRRGGSAVRPPTRVSTRAASSVPNSMRSGSGQPSMMPATQPAWKASPQPVESTSSGTVKAG